MRSYCSSYAKTFFLCFFGFTLGRILIFPGFIDLAAPSHDDLYRYFLISQESWGFSEWLKPRPLMRVFLYGLGSIVKTPTTLWVVLSLTSILFIAALIEFLKEFYIQDIAPWAIILYSATLFSLPSSWEIHQLDYGGFLSGLLCIAALSLFLSRLRNNANSGSVLFAPLLMYWAVLETKPTFGAVVLALSVLLFFSRRDIISGLAILGVLVVSVLVFLKDKHLGSAFIGADGAGTYEVKLSLVDNLLALTTYLTSSIPYSLIPGLLVVYGICIFNKKTRPVAFFSPLLALSAIAPMILIPNRVLTLYSWYSSLFFLLPLLVLSVDRGNHYALAVKRITVLSVGAIILGQFFFSASSGSMSAYNVSLSKYNRNIFESLADLRINAPLMNSNRALVSGLQGPFHAFRQEPFVRDRSGLVGYTLLLRHSERSWNESSLGLGSSISLDKLDLERFNSFIVYGSDGRVKYTLSREQLMNIPDVWRAAVIFCGAGTNFNEISTSDIDGVMACFGHSDEPMAAIRLGKSNGIPEKLGPFGLYHFGDALIKTGEYVLARRYLELALSMADHPAIRAKLESIE